MVFKKIKVKYKDEEGNEVVKTYPFLLNIYAQRMFAELQPNYPVNKLGMDTPDYVFADLIYCGIAGGYKKEGKAVPETLKDEVETNFTSTEILDIWMQANDIDAEQLKELDPKPKAKETGVR